MQRLGRRVKIAGTVVRPIDVHPTIMVKIQKSSAGAESLRQIALVSPGILVNPGDTALGSGNVFEKGRRIGGKTTQPN